LAIGRLLCGDGHRFHGVGIVFDGGELTSHVKGPDMKRTRFALLLAALVASPALATPVGVHGDLKVKGNRIVDASGNPTQLVGMSMYWSIWGGEKYYTPEVVAWMARDWRISLVRAAIAAEPTGGYLTNPDLMVARAKIIVDAAIANGIYVIVDWHDHNASAHVTQAKAFFETMAKAYGDSPNVIWEIWNEPDGTGGSGTGGADTWNDIKAYANEVTPVIRKYSKNIVVVGTTAWSQGVDGPAASPAADANTAYTLHFYAKSHKQWLRDKADAALAKGIALFVTEWGTTNADGGSAANRGVDTVESALWLKWAADRKISWANWSVVNFTESSAALAAGASTKGGWSEGDLSVSGAWVRRQILATNPTAATLPAQKPGEFRVVVRGRGLEFAGLAEGATKIVVRGIDGREVLRSSATGVSMDLPAGLHGMYLLEVAESREVHRAAFLVP